MNALLERLAGFAARKHWVIIIAWLIILGGLLAAQHAYGGEYVNNYTVSGSESEAGINVLNSTFPQQGGFGGQIVFHARTAPSRRRRRRSTRRPPTCRSCPTSSRRSARSPRPIPAAVSKDGTIAYASVAWNVNPDSLDTAYLDKLDNAVAPATRPACRSSTAPARGRSGRRPRIKSEIIGLSCALVLLLLMFGSVIAAAIPLVSAIFSVVGRARAARAACLGGHDPDHRPTIATLLGLGVAVDYGLFLVARHREQVDSGMDVVPSVRLAAGTSGAAIVVAGSTVAVSVLGLYISGVSFVGSLGLAAALVVVVTMLAALTLVPAFMGLIGKTFGRCRPGSGPARLGCLRRNRPARPPRPPTSSTSTARSPGGGGWSAGVRGRGPWPAWRCSRAGDPAVLDHARPARQRHEPHIGQQPPGLRPDLPGLRRRRQRAADRRRQAAEAVQLGNSSLLTHHAEGRLQDRRRRVGQARGRELRRHHGGLQRDPDHTAQATATTNLVTSSATPCCPRNTRPATSRAPRRGRSTSPARSPVGC